jgi:cell division septation protein DedD
MSLDYSQRKQVSRNRPKKRSSKPFLLLILGVISGVYGLGIFTGWLLFKDSRKSIPPVVSDPTKSVESSKVSESSPSSKNTASIPSPPGKGNDTPLTFYYTLPKGDKGVIGSGVNLPREDSAALAKRDLPPPQTSAMKQQPAVKSEQRVLSTDASGSNKEKPVNESKPPLSKDKQTDSLLMKQKIESGKAGYSVQAGSYHDKNEAQDLKNILDKNGFSARIVEYAIPGKGVLYRVRIGNRMEKETATRLAAKIGKNAIAVPE